MLPVVVFLVGAFAGCVGIVAVAESLHRAWSGGGDFWPVLSFGFLCLAVSVNQIVASWRLS